MNFRILRCLLICLVALSACDRAGEIAEPRAAQESSSSSETLTDTAATALARAVAVALNDDGVRSALLKAIRSSPSSEGKLLLRDFLETPDGVKLGEKITAQIGMSSSLTELLDRLPPLEIYLPVKTHRTAWKGGSKMLVVVQIDEDSQPVGFDLNGFPVPVSLNKPPLVPTLVLVPYEGRHQSEQAGVFVICNPETQNCGGSGGGGGSNESPGGIYLTYSHIPDMREPWTRGEPELEALLIGPNATTRTLGQIYACAHQGRTGYAFYDQDHSYWYGAADGENDALIASASEIEQAQAAYPDSLTQEYLQIAIIEDDDDRCVVNDDDNEFRQNTRDAWLYLTGSAFLIAAVDWSCNDCDWYFVMVLIGIGQGITDFIQALGDDDLIGISEKASVWNSRVGDNVTRTHVLVRDHTRRGEIDIHVRPIGFYTP